MHPIAPPILAAATSTRRREKLATMENSSRNIDACHADKHARLLFRRFRLDNYSLVVAETGWGASNVIRTLNAWNNRSVNSVLCWGSPDATVERIRLVGGDHVYTVFGLFNSLSRDSETIGVDPVDTSEIRDVAPHLRVAFQRDNNTLRRLIWTEF
jgi:hypothetical protein